MERNKRAFSRFFTNLILNGIITHFSSIWYSVFCNNCTIYCIKNDFREGISLNLPTRNEAEIIVDLVYSVARLYRFNGNTSGMLHARDLFFYIKQYI